MRTISLVNRLKWCFSGNMNPHALVLGDVDNDGDIEFVIGNLNGELAIFKGECPLGSPSFSCQELGTITCIAVGDVRNEGKNSLVVINAEGLCHIFDIPAGHHTQPSTPPHSNPSHAQHQVLVDEYLRQGRRSSDSASSHHGSRRPTVQMDDQSQRNANEKQQQNSSTIFHQPTVTLKVPVNVNKILIADIDGDGYNELILARTDRILHSFHLDYLSGSADRTEPSTPTSTNSPPSTLSSTIQSSLSALSGNKLGVKANNEGKESKSHVLRKGMVWKSGKTKEVKGSKATSENLYKAALDRHIYLRDKDMWVFDGQITSLTTTHYPDRPNEPVLLVAQPGNTFTIIDQKGNRLNRDFTPQCAPYIYDRRQQPVTSTAQHKKKISTLLSTSSASLSQQQINNVMAASPLPTTSIPVDINHSLLSIASSPSSASMSSANESKESSASTMRTLLHRLTVTNDNIHENVILASEDDLKMDSNSSSSSFAGNDNDGITFYANRSDRLQDWPMTDGDNIMGDDQNGAVATEIVVGKSHGNVDQHRHGNEIGMLSMDGKFTIYDLRTKKISQQDLFVTHKLFSLATLDVTSTPVLPRGLYPARNAPLYFAGSQLLQQQQQQQSLQQQKEQQKESEIQRQQQQRQQPQRLSQPQQKYQMLATRHPSLASAASSPSSSGRAVATTATTTAIAHSNGGSPSFSTSSKLSLTVSNGNGVVEDANATSSSKSLASPSLVTTSATSQLGPYQQDANSSFHRETSTEIAQSETQSVMSKQQDPSYFDQPLNSISNITGSNNDPHSRRGSRSSGISSWSDLNDDEMDGPDCDLFVACAWNGVTYLIDWSRRYEEGENDAMDVNAMSTSESFDSSNIRFQLVKFAFEGRVCAFTAGLYAVAPGYNVPCLFYVDFEDQIFVYYDVRILPGKVTGFNNMIDDDVEEAFDRLLGIEQDLTKTMQSAFDPVLSSQRRTAKQQPDIGDNDAPHDAGKRDNHDDDDDENETEEVDLGDGWKGVMDDTTTLDSLALPSDPSELADFIHECLYEFDDMKEQLENDLFVFEHEHLSHTVSSQADIRRLSDLNITIEPELESEISESEEGLEEQGIFVCDDMRSSQSSDSEILRNWMDENLLRSNIGE